LVESIIIPDTTTATKKEPKEDLTKPQPLLRVEDLLNKTKK